MTKPLNILVLDDHVDVASSIGEVLELDGHAVTLAHSGRSAIEAYASRAFDLGIFDIKMPGMSGVESFFEIRKQRPDASVVLMSGYADNEEIKRALQGGAKGLLKKPFEVRDLFAKIKEIELA